MFVNNELKTYFKDCWKPISYTYKSGVLKILQMFNSFLNDQNTETGEGGQVHFYFGGTSCTGPPQTLY